MDIAQIRDLGFVVADGRGFWVEVKRLWQHTVELLAPGVPAVRVVHRHARFELALQIVPGAERDALIIDVALSGDETLRPYALLAPHLGGTGWNNQAEIAEQAGRRVLRAVQGPFALALAAVDSLQHDAIGRASAGVTGASDGWQDFARNGAMTWEYTSAGPGNVALIAELPRSGGEPVIADPDATRAAYAVGYESASQFSREYARMFGAPPPAMRSACEDRRLWQKTPW